MNRQQLQKLLQSVQENDTSIEQAVDEIAATAIHSSDVAQLDLHRELRCGAPEAVYCEGKTIEQCATIAAQFVETKHKALFTRCTAQQAAAILEVLGDVLIQLEGLGSGSRLVEGRFVEDGSNSLNRFIENLRIEFLESGFGLSVEFLELFVALLELLDVFEDGSRVHVCSWLCE